MNCFQELQEVSDKVAFVICPDLVILELVPVVNDDLQEVVSVTVASSVNSTVVMKFSTLTDP